MIPPLTHWQHKHISREPPPGLSWLGWLTFYKSRTCAVGVLSLRQSGT
jgi:hypothetical protein